MVKSKACYDNITFECVIFNLIFLPYYTVDFIIACYGIILSVIIPVGIGMKP